MLVVLPETMAHMLVMIMLADDGALVGSVLDEVNGCIAHLKIERTHLTKNSEMKIECLPVLDVHRKTSLERCSQRCPSHDHDVCSWK